MSTAAHPYADAWPMPVEGYSIFGGYLTDGRAHSVTLRHEASHPGYAHVSVSNGSGTVYETRRPVNMEGVQRWAVAMCENEGVDPNQLIWADPTPIPKPPTVNFVYFIADEDGYIKIGHAKNVTGRLAMLQTAARQQLRLLATMRGGPSDERALHRRFTESRIRGEWFAPTPELLALIQEVAE